ncbi:mobilization protein [Marinomonas mediterranea]|jgi:CobQ/CobB/MinD/ParA nucleotide binding domain.|uniref:Putative mobilization protein MobD n=1 Tax=Marinomonas mediterranea (strain ATCC 700492 / JCM 21426 / NBRC 103028 / MMB-1) TaxID=717774 RepID=F2JWI1_MARM1|nr:mobilization protein [Marinomonas mediterranea]ADZ90654.1 putative mobilization protein MobD [Marinomonas mediterranea MMB-1]WCN08703.1 mobilization protein [Marinomonas mediterranea]WCN12750.1 mobilization protein [Marinomonas mediterranea]WCN16824.1 mobilization protein [Marinomonas mediterranea MMB-1]
MRKVHFIGGEKGGVGKSMTARLLAQYYIDKELDFVGFDCDSSHTTFSRFYSDFASPVIVGDDDSLDGMLATIEAFPDKDLIIDLAAQSAQPLGKWIAETDVFGLLDELGYQVCLWHVMDDGADSVSLLDKLLTQYKESEVDFVVVQNYGRGSDFSRFKSSDTFKAAEDSDALIIELPKLQTKLTQKIDFNNSSFWAVANNKSLMNIAERQRMRVWLRNAYEQLDQLG